MDHNSNHHWYSQNRPRNDPRIPSQQSPNTNINHHGFTNAANQTVQHAQQMLAGFPMASATPALQPVRHIANMTMTAAPPSFVQPNYYSSQAQPDYTHVQQHNSQHIPPPPYTEYDQHLSYLSAPQVPQNRTEHWHTARDQSVRLLNEQASRSYPYQEPQQPSNWPASSYQSTPFAQSVFQRTTPNSAYPTPPPPGISTSSSSLAFALGGPPQPPPRQQTVTQPLFHPTQAPLPQPAPAPQPAPVPQATVFPPPSNPPAAQASQPTYNADDSASFFNSFLERKTREMNATMQQTTSAKSIFPPAPAKLPLPVPVASKPPARMKTPPPREQKAVPDSSPDPLSLSSNMALPSSTPLKRKCVVEIHSPPPKRIQSYKPMTLISQPLTPSRGPPLTPTSRASNASSVPTTASSSTSITSMSSSSKTTVPMTPTPQRIVNKAFVLVPPSPWLTPSSRKGRKYEDTPDLGGYGSSEDTPLRRGLMSSVKRTGERDDRGPLEKFVTVVDEIFESEDSLPADLGHEDLPQEFFSSWSPDCSKPLLNTSTIRKLLKYVGQVARPTKRMRQASAGGQGLLATPRTRAGRMADVDIQTLSRLLKMLERSLKEGEEVDPFKATGSSSGLNGTVSARSSPVKKGSRKKKAKDSLDDDDSMEADEADELPQQHLKKGSTPPPNDIELEKLTRLLDLARDSVLAADCCIAILASDRLPKQLYSEELITSCLNTVKNQLTKVLYPFIEGASPDSINSKLYNGALLQHLIKNAPADPNTSANSSISQAYHRKQMSEIFQSLSSVLPRINALANAESVAMSDSIIIQTVYIAIGPFFVVEGAEESTAKSASKKEKESVVNRTLGKSAMRGLRLDALSLIRSIFSNHEDQRSWIIEEILTSLIKLSDTKQKAGQFRLRDGRSIRTVSALLMQLVQTSAHDVRINARRLEKERQNALALKRQESISDLNGQPKSDEPFLDNIDMEEIRLYGGGLESATKAAKTIIFFLNSRAGKGKTTKNSNEAEYRAIFDNLIDDLLVVLYWPEWPAASLLLNIASKFMVSSLDDVKSNAQIDTNAAKSMALDHLGVIAARIRSSILKVQKDEDGTSYRGLKPLDEIVNNLQSKQFAKFMDAHRDVAAHLCKRSTEDQAYESARELTAAILGHELAASLKRVNVWLDHPEQDEDLDLRDSSKALSFGQKLKTALREVWKDPATDVFDIGSQEEVSRIDRLSEEIGTIQSLRNSFQPILNVILSALDAPVIFMRTKALRALGQIVTSDATILGTASVRQGIENHLLDSSPAVRDAAVELIGKYMIDSPEVAGNYYQKIAERMADTGLAVRKRVIKLLKSYYGVIDDTQRKIDISARLVLRMVDEDDGVKDLAMKTLEELWFPPLPPPSAMKVKPTSSSNPNQDKAALLSKVAIIMGTAANFRDRQSPLEDMLHKIISDKEGNEAASLHQRYAEICETLIDGLVDATDLPGFTIINCIRTIHLFTAAYPSILPGTHASTLLPYLKNASTTEELLTSDFLLKIFRASIPHMPKTAAKFGQELQTSLQPLILKPFGGVNILQEAVGCMCAVVRHLTHDFKRLINLLKGCNARLLSYLRHPPTKQLNNVESKTLLMLLFIVALLGEHCNFDRLRLEQPDLAPDIDSITQGSVMEHIYFTLLRIYDKFDFADIRPRILQCLGFLFRAQPTLMTKEESAAIMDAIFASEEEEGRARLLKIMQDFLISESEKHSAKEKESAKNKNKANTDVNMEELVGNTDGFADSGVSSAIVQRYLSHILDAALSQNSQIQMAAIDVLTFTIKQGLAHPLQSFPVIIALETSPHAVLSARAIALHSILNSKHASLLNTRYSISARKSFDYQKKIVDGVVHGFRTNGHPTALLQRWYTLVREKRATRQDFLKSLVKVFSENDSYQATQDDVDFTRYMAENFASFEYKTQEEVFTVIKHLTTVLSTTGMQLLDIISPAHLLSQIQPSHSQPSQHNGGDEISSNAAEAVVPLATPNYGDRDPVSLMRTSVIVAMVMLLKSYLKTLYGLSEDKCNKFVIGKKSAIGDRPATKRSDKPISWEKLPYAVQAIHTTQDVELQKQRFLEIWNEDGVTAEPEDDEFL
ncbi:proline-rich protein Rad9 [Coprinopsis cinerea AmutBmut pab1-1]|nr:proline-rich protein Rad9 [Coprinopsis cinerea AmutBmut pab1-1]